MFEINERKKMQNYWNPFKASWVSNNTYDYLRKLNDDLSNKRKTKTKLQVCLLYLKFSNQKKRELKERVTNKPYPDYIEWNKLVEREKKCALKIINIIKTIKNNCIKNYAN